MTQKTEKELSQSQRSGRIRAIRQEGARQQLQRSRIKLGLGGEFAELDLSMTYRLVRALRLARRAARSGSKDYDPARHLLLARYCRSLEQGKTSSRDLDQRPRPEFADRRHSGRNRRKAGPPREEV